MPPGSESRCDYCAPASTSSGGVFDLPRLKARGEELEQETARPDFWSDREQAEKISRERNRVARDLDFYERLAAAIDDSGVLLELATEARDDDTLAEVAQKVAEASDTLEEAELRQLLGGEHDAADAILSINSGP